MIAARRIPLGIFSWYDYDVPMQDRFQSIRKAGFEATSLYWSAEDNNHGCDPEALPAMARDAGLLVENAHVPYETCNDLWSEQAPVRERILSQHLCWVEDMARHRIPCMVMHLTGGADLPAPGTLCLDSMSRIVAAAEELGVVVAVENTRRRDYVDFVLREVKSAHLGFCYDSSHARLNTDQGIGLLRDWGHRLTAVHLSDNDGRLDQHRLPGVGVIDWPILMAAFPVHCYTGCLTLEVVPPNEVKPSDHREFLAQAYPRALWLGGLLPSALNQ